jgi:hypothetical protein
MTEDRKYLLKVTADGVQYDCDFITFNIQERVMQLNMYEGCGITLVLENVESLIIEKWQT